MTSFAISGFGVLCSAGTGPAVLRRALAGESAGERKGRHAVDLDVQAQLGKKGTLFLDRRSALALVACQHALADGGVDPRALERTRFGVVLGTTWGSFQSMSNYTRETFTEDRPYLVTPGLFPTTVMNCASGESAIRFGLKGVNATVAGGPLAFLNVLTYAGNALERDHADVFLAGAVEELTAHSEWLGAVEGLGEAPGEGAAAFVVERARASGGHDAEIVSIASAYSPTGRSLGRSLADCIARALRQAGVGASEIRITLTRQAPGQDDVEGAALRLVSNGSEPARIAISPLLGECLAASGALQLAAVLSLHRDAPARDGELSLLTSFTNSGGVGAAVVRGWSRGANHG